MLDDVIDGQTMAPPSKSEVEAVMVGQERWEQIRQMFFDEKMAIAEIARRLGMDRKTVRRWVRTQWKPYQRAAKEETLLMPTQIFCVSEPRKFSTPHRFSFRSCDACAAIVVATRQ